MRGLPQALSYEPSRGMYSYRLCRCSSDNAIEQKKKNLLPVIVLVKKKHVKNREKGTM